MFANRPVCIELMLDHHTPRRGIVQILPPAGPLHVNAVTTMSNLISPELRERFRKKIQTGGVFAQQSPDSIDMRFVSWLSIVVGSRRRVYRENG